jgi:hypothetical protein
MDENEDEPFGWWGWHWQPAVPLSIIQLVQAGSTDTSLMSLLWSMLARRASVLVAAEPAMAGKTTTLTALLDLIPPGSKKVYLKGHYENFDFAGEPGTDPANTYVLANEMSDHLATYLWGSRIYKTFELTTRGYAIGSTMHAETVEDVICILNSDPLFVPPEWIANLTLVINLYVSGTYGGSQRRFNTVHMLMPPSDDDHASILPGVGQLLLSRWDRKTDTFDHRFMRPEVVAELAQWAGISPEEWQFDVAQRKAYLDELLDAGETAIHATRARLALFQG